MSSAAKKPARPSGPKPVSKSPSSTSPPVNQSARQSSHKSNKSRQMDADLDLAAARSFLTDSQSINQSALLTSQADRRNKLKKRVLILQTEKIKEMLWEKASLSQKKQLIDEELRELNSLRQRIEFDREERQKRWALEEAMRCEEEDEEIRFSTIRMRKFQQRYEFECTKREKMLKSRAEKEGRKSGQSHNEEKELGYDDDGLVDETDGYEFMSPGGTLDPSTLSRGPNDKHYSHPSTTLDDYAGEDQDDVDFLSSDEEDADHDSELDDSLPEGAEQPLLQSPLPPSAANDLEPKNETEQAEDPAEIERRQVEEAAEQEERARREAEERATKEREWQALKSRLLAEARELQDKERQRVAEEREAEQKRAADALAAKEAEMSVLIAKLKDAEHKLPPLPALPESANQSSTPRNSESPVPAPTIDTESTTTTQATPSPLPALSSITLRPAASSVSQQSQSFANTNSVTVSLDEDLVDEPTQAPGAITPLPSLSAVPQRRLNTNPVSPTPPPKKRETDSMAISSMLAELDELEEQEESLLKMGVEVTKVPRTGKPKVVKLYIDRNEEGQWVVRWDTKKSNKNDACVVLNRSIRVIQGISGGLFTKPENEKRFGDKRNRCFSVIAADRTLDVCCLTFNDQELWTRTITRLSKEKPRRRAPEPAPQPQPLILEGIPTEQVPLSNYAPQPTATHSRVSSIGSILIGRDQAR